MFERDEITGALAARGFEDVRQRVSGLTQFVGARKGRRVVAMAADQVAEGVHRLGSPLSTSTCRGRRR